MACLCCGRGKGKKEKMADKKFIDECLKTHNGFRKKHNVPALKHNKQMGVAAQKWAEHLAETNTFSHNPERKFKGESMGENIAMKYTSGGEDFTGAQVAQQWYDEAPRYDFSRNGGPSTSHFTQVVWKASRDLGLGKAKTKDGKWIVVADYCPAGNMMGQNAENVFPPKDGKLAISAKGAEAPVPEAAAGSVSQEPEGRSQTTTTRSTTTEQRGGKTYSKTIITETTIGADGQKKTVTREIVSGGGDGNPDEDLASRFKLMGADDRLAWADSQIAPAKAKPQELKDFVEDVVKMHNKYRKIHGKVGDLKHNKDLDAQAQKWAEHLASTGVLAHSNATHNGKQLGENVASKWSTAGADYTGEEVVDHWYKEHDKYDYNNDNFVQGFGHFTQIVWKDSKEIGIGKAHKSDGSRCYIVAFYHPAGNVMGQFRDNVHRK